LISLSCLTFNIYTLNSVALLLAFINLLLITKNQTGNKEKICIFMIRGMTQSGRRISNYTHDTHD